MDGNIFQFVEKYQKKCLTLKDKTIYTKVSIKEANMKRLILMLTLIVSSAWAGVMPEGTFKGIGDYVTQGGPDGSYRVETTIDADGNFNSKYHWADQSTSLALQAKGNQASFDVLMKGMKIGEGSCAENRCDYAAKGPDIDVKETLVFANDKLLRFGTKIEKGAHITWFEKQIK
jgi:hypothetical protein